MSDKAGLLEIVRSCIVHEPIVSHSGLDLDWWCDLGKAYERFSLLMHHLGPLKAIPAGIETHGWNLAIAAPSFVKVRVTKDGRVYVDDFLHPHMDDPDEVALVDDICTTGKSFIDAEVALSKRGIVVVERVCVLDRREEVQADMSLGVRSLFTTKDVV